VTMALEAPALLWDDGEVVIEPPGDGDGAWAGAPSAIVVDGVYWLAYRLRLPLGAGRGIANVVARSLDGVHFDTVAVVDKEPFGAESLERPALVFTPEGQWRLYVSCATPGTKRWRIDLVEASEAAGLTAAAPRTVLPGDEKQAVKDPVVLRGDDGVWHLWASVHPLDLLGAEDRMTTEHYTSSDGIGWAHRGRALDRLPDRWDSRGVRVTAVLPGDTVTAWYDGRASAAENWEERTGLATGADLTTFVASGTSPVAQSPYAPGGLRYLSVVTLPDGEGHRLYYEATRADGAHELRTQLVASPNV
jgi:sucrose-6-phosphate hydrolase SacC (GH32 family)